MEDDLKRKLLSDIEKTGFGSEMRATKSFLQRGWNCFAGESYFDRDEGKTRTIDFAAYRSARFDPEQVVCGLRIFAEVKKSERPWIVFKYQEMEEIETSSESYLHVQSELPFDFPLINQALRETSLRKQCGWIARGVHEAFKDPSQPSRWHPAFISLCKACDDYASNESLQPHILKQLSNDRLLIFCHPILILDGVLVSASLSDDGNIILEETGFAPFEFDFRSSHYNRDPYRVDIVAMSYLEKYIVSCENRFQKVSEMMHKLCLQPKYP